MIGGQSMPEFIISQDENILNYINKLNQPYADSMKNRMVNMLSKIVLTEGHNTASLLST